MIRQREWIWRHWIEREDVTERTLCMLFCVLANQIRNLSSVNILFLEKQSKNLTKYKII